MKLHEIHEFSETDIPIIYHLLESKLKQHVPVRYVRFTSEPNTWVDSIKIEYDDIRETHSICVTVHDKNAKSHAYETLAWEIPVMTDRLVLEKRDEGYVFFDREWVDVDMDNPKPKRASRGR